VALDEAPTMMTNIVDTYLDTVTAGWRVKAVFKKTQGGFSIPMFTPSGDSQR
jgi:uncharacterized OB-fold protein